MNNTICIGFQQAVHVVGHVFVFIYKCLVKIQINLLFSTVEGDWQSEKFPDFAMLALTHQSKAKHLTEALVIHVSVCSLLEK